MSSAPGKLATHVANFEYRLAMVDAEDAAKMLAVVEELAEGQRQVAAGMELWLAQSRSADEMLAKALESSVESNEMSNEEAVEMKRKFAGNVEEYAKAETSMAVAFGASARLKAAASACRTRLQMESALV